MNCRLAKGYAEIRLPSGGALLSPGGAESLMAALDQCAQVHAIFFEVISTLEEVDRDLEQIGKVDPVAGEVVQAPNEAALVAGAAEEGSRSLASMGLDSVLEKLGQMPHLLVGFASGAIGLAETCIFATCDVIFATSTTTFQLQHEVSTPLALLPLAILRRLGAHGLEQLPAGCSGSISAAVALRLGLASELVDSEDELTSRLGDISSRFQKNPTTAVASLKWLQRRTSRLGQSSTQASSSATAHGIKRSAECWLQVPVKRMKVERASEEGFHQRCEIVASALRGSTDHGLPAATGKLLAEVVCSSTRQVPDSRSDFEKSIAEIIGSALCGIGAQLEQVVREASAMLEVAEGERVIRDGAQLQEESKLLSTRQKMVELRATVTSNNDALRVSMAGLAEAVEAQEAGDSRYKELNEEKLKLEGLERDVYEPTKMGAFPKAKANKNAKELMLMGKNYGFDESLLIGLPGALSKKPTDRSTFDTMVLSAFESQIMTKIAEAETSMSEEMPGREARAAVVSSARSAFEAVKERHTATLAELAAAQVRLKEGEGEVRESQRQVQSFGQEVQQLMRAKEDAESKLTAFRNGPLAMFEDLRGGSVDSHAVIVPECEGLTAQDRVEGNCTAPGPEPSDDAVMTTQVDSAEVETQPEEAPTHDASPKKVDAQQAEGDADVQQQEASNEEAKEAADEEAKEESKSEAGEEAQEEAEEATHEEAKEEGKLEADEEANKSENEDVAEEAQEKEKSEADEEAKKEDGDDPMDAEEVEKNVEEAAEEAKEVEKVADEEPDSDDDYA